MENTLIPLESHLALDGWSQNIRFGWKFQEALFWRIRRHHSGKSEDQFYRRLRP